MPPTANVEGEEHRLTTSEEQIIELRTTSVIDASDLSIENCMVLNCTSERCGKRGEGAKLMAISRYERTLPLALVKVWRENHVPVYEPARLEIIVANRKRRW